MSTPRMATLARAVQRTALRPQSTKSLIKSASPRLFTSSTTSFPLLSTSPRWLQCQKIPTRAFSHTSTARAGLMPDSADPEPPKTEDIPFQPRDATPIDDEEYIQLSDRFLDYLLEKTELAQESRDDVDVEYSAGVMNITLGQQGTWVINKQPPNRQIWLSSPVSGPKRYDWVVEGEAMHEKEGGGVGQWVYLRDGTTLADLIQKELDINVDPHTSEADVTKPSQDPIE